jgi:2-methylcitrate dehydratase PrpD
VAVDHAGHDCPPSQVDHTIRLPAAPEVRAYAGDTGILHQDIGPLAVAAETIYDQTMCEQHRRHRRRAYLDIGAGAPYPVVLSTTATPLEAHTRALIDHVLRAQWDGLPAAAQQSTRLIVLDTLGAMLGACAPQHALARLLGAYAESEGGVPRASIVGQERQTGPSLAALINGTLAYALDMESIHGPSITHAAAVVVPACLAVAESEGCSGPDLLAAVTVGLDVADRVSRAIGPRAMYARGFHPSAVAGAPAAALAAARLLRLDSTRARRALGLAALQAGGLMIWEADPSEQSRPFNCGTAARNGVTAAVLAAGGLGAPENALTGHDGMLGAFGDPASNWSVLDEGLGEHFAATETQIKRFACCAFLQPGVEAIVGLKHEHTVDPARASAIMLEFPRGGAAIIDGNPVRSHCGQYVLAVALVNGNVTFDDLASDRRTSVPEIAAVAERIEVVHSDELDAEFPERYTSRVRLRLDDGQSFERMVVYPMGHPRNPLSEEQVAEKFRMLAAPVIGSARAESVMRIAANLPRETSIAPLMAALRAPVAPALQSGGRGGCLAQPVA